MKLPTNSQAIATQASSKTAVSEKDSKMQTPTGRAIVFKISNETVMGDGAAAPKVAPLLPGLLRLARETRDQIYGEVLVQNKHLKPVASRYANHLCAGRFPSEALTTLRSLRICSQIYAEAKEIRCKNNLLVLEINENLKLSTLKAAFNVNIIIDSMFWHRELEDVVIFLQAQPTLFNLELKVRVRHAAWREDKRLDDLLKVLDPLRSVQVQYKCELKMVHGEVQWKTKEKMVRGEVKTEKEMEINQIMLALSKKSHMRFQKVLREMEEEMEENWLRGKTGVKI